MEKIWSILPLNSETEVREDTCHDNRHFVNTNFLNWNVIKCVTVEYSHNVIVKAIQETK